MILSFEPNKNWENQESVQPKYYLIVFWSTDESYKDLPYWARIE